MAEATADWQKFVRMWTADELRQRLAAELERRGLNDKPPSDRTLRYYGSLGLCDRPSWEERLYGERHLLQLLAIAVLKAAYLPLPEIQKLLFGRGDDDLRKIIENPPEPPPPPPIDFGFSPN